MKFEKILKALNKKNIKYMVAGGIAVNLHGYIRATADLDILMLLDDANISLFVDMVKELGFRPRIPVDTIDFSNKQKREGWIKEKEMKVFSVYNPENIMEGIDVMIEEVIDFESAYKRREIVHVGDVDISLISISDLIKLKEVSGRDRDKIDIEALKRIKVLKDEK